MRLHVEGQADIGLLNVTMTSEKAVPGFISSSSAKYRNQLLSLEYELPERSSSEPQLPCQLSSPKDCQHSKPSEQTCIGCGAETLLDTRSKSLDSLGCVHGNMYCCMAEGFSCKQSCGTSGPDKTNGNCQEASRPVGGWGMRLQQGPDRGGRTEGFSSEVTHLIEGLPRLNSSSNILCWVEAGVPQQREEDRICGFNARKASLPMPSSLQPPCTWVNSSKLEATLWDKMVGLLF